MTIDPKGQDLLSQISAPDRVDVAPKKEQSIFMVAVVRSMRMILQFDELRRKNAQVFQILGVLWGILMGVLYAGGIVAMVILIYSYMHFPEFVEEYFDRSKIAVKDFKIGNYDFSKIEIRNMTDAEGTYKIKKVTIYSSFSEFLKRRVKSVVVDGVTMNIKETKDGLDFGNLPQVLTRLNQDTSGDKVHINTLSVMNAQIDFNGQKFNFPITFSLTGAYDKDTKLSVPFSIKEDNVKLVGALSVTGTAKDMSWTLDVSSGTLSMPDSYPENITGNLVFKTKQMKMTGVSGNIRLSYGKNIKAFQINLTKNGNEFKGNIHSDIVNQNAGADKTEIRTNVDLSFDGLRIPSLTRVETNKPIRISMQSFSRENISFSDLSGEVQGKLVCDGLNCTYKLSQSAMMTMRQLQWILDGVRLESTQPISFTLAPATQKDAVTLSYANNKTIYNGVLKKVLFSGFMRDRQNTLRFEMEKGSFSGERDMRTHTQKLAFQLEDVTYETPTRRVRKAFLKTDDVFAKVPVVRIEADSVRLKDHSLINVPFKLSLDQEGERSRALLSLEKDKVRISLNGNMRLRTGEFIGEVFMHPVDLAQLPQPLSKISGFFPQSIKNASGTMAVLGNLNWKNANQIAGPLFVAFKDVSFNSDNLRVKGLNTVLLFQSLVPFTTPAPQNVFVAEVSGPLPLQNVNGQVKLENQLMRITSLQAQAGGLDLRMDPIIVPYKTDSITMYLRNSAFDFGAVNATLADKTISLSGRGSITIPVRYDKGLFVVRNGEFRITNGYIGYTGTNEAVKKMIFHDASRIYVPNGNGTFNSAGNGDIYSLYLNLDARLPAAGGRYRVKETVAGVLGQWLAPVPTAEVPEVIASKQAVIIK